MPDPFPFHVVPVGLMLPIEEYSTLAPAVDRALALSRKDDFKTIRFYVTNHTNDDFVVAGSFCRGVYRSSVVGNGTMEANRHA